MHFALREPADLARHAQRLVTEHKRLTSKGGVGTIVLLNGLGDAFVKNDNKNFNSRITPKIISRVFYQYTSARLVHQRLFAKLMDMTAATIKDFKAQELHDMVKSLSHTTWKPPKSRGVLLESEITQRVQCFSFQQSAEVLFSLSHLRLGGPKLYANMSKHLKDMYPLVGSHISARDVASTLRSFATMTHSDRQLFDMLSLRLSHPDMCNSLSVHQGSRIVWSFVMLSWKQSDVVNLVLERCHTVLKQSKKSEINSSSISPLMWSAATVGGHNALIAEACRCCSLSDINTWKSSTILWSLAHSGVDVRTSPEMISLVEGLMGIVKKERDFTTQICPTLAWSLTTLGLRDTEIFDGMYSFLRKDDWLQLDKFSDAALVDLIASFAECHEDIVEMQQVVATRIHKTTNGKVMAKFAWVLATTKAENSKQLFRMVSHWSRKVNIATDLSVDDQSTLLWAASALRVDTKLQDHITELLA